MVFIIKACLLVSLILLCWVKLYLIRLDRKYVNCSDCTRYSPDTYTGRDRLTTKPALLTGARHAPGSVHLLRKSGNVTHEPCCLIIFIFLGGRQWTDRDVVMSLICANTYQHLMIAAQSLSHEKVLKGFVLGPSTGGFDCKLHERRYPQNTYRVYTAWSIYPLRLAVAATFHLEPVHGHTGSDTSLASRRMPPLLPAWEVFFGLRRSTNDLRKDRDVSI